MENVLAVGDKSGASGEIPTLKLWERHGLVKFCILKEYPSYQVLMHVQALLQKHLSIDLPQRLTFLNDYSKSHQYRITSTRHIVTASAGSKVTTNDKRYMQEALDLAKRALGQTHPNPAVGALILDAQGTAVGRGYHPQAGLPHAEIYALRAAGQAAEGGTAYVTLEPCNHFGRTPPCALALIDAKVSRVVVGTVDPNPLVGGQGIERIRNAGITVAVGCLEDECYALNKEWMEGMKTKGRSLRRESGG
jgi:pyrimidine deaminase RibD-like protein